MSMRTELVLCSTGRNNVEARKKAVKGPTRSFQQVAVGSAHYLKAPVEAKRAYDQQKSFFLLFLALGTCSRSILCISISAAMGVSFDQSQKKP